MPVILVSCFARRACHTPHTSPTSANPCHVILVNASFQSHSMQPNINHLIHHPSLPTSSTLSLTTLPGLPLPSPFTQHQFTVQSNSCSRINFPSLYFSVCSYARSYFHPTVSLHCRQAMSRTTWRPVVMLRSPASPAWMLTTLLKRKALPCWPRKFCGGKGRVSERVSRGGRRAWAWWVDGGERVLFERM